MIAPRVRIRWVLIPLTLVGLSCTASRTEDTPPDPPNSSTEASVPEEAVSPTATATTAAPVRHNLFSQAGALAFLVDLPEGATGPGIDRALATLIGENGFSPDFPFIELAGGQEPVWVQLLSSGPFDARTLQLFAAMAVYGTGGDDRGATIPWDKRLEDALLRIVIATPAGNEFPELDDRTRQILVDAWLANIAQHVASGVEGGRAWYEPATTIEIEESFRRVGDSYEGVLWMVSDDGSRSEVPTEARLTNGRWVIDAFDLLAPEPIVLAFSYEDVETTDITVVVSVAGGEGDPAVEIIEVTDVTVVDNDPSFGMRVGTLRLPPGSRVAFALGLGRPAPSGWEPRTIGASGAQRVAVPAEGLTIFVTMPDGTNQIWHLAVAGFLVKQG